MTRSELLTALKHSRAEMDSALAGLTEAQMTEPGVVGEWSVKDLLSHLTAWEVQLVTTLGQLQRGQRLKSVPWTDEEAEKLNAQWSVDYRDRPLENVLADFHAVRPQTARQVERLTEADLSEPRAFLKGDTLAKMIAVETFEHEAEHLPHLRAWREGKGI